jgi:paraquat-inducible protein B
MAEPPVPPNERPPVDELPAAVPDPQSHKRVPYVWILPALVVLAGAFVAIQQKIAQGTSIEIGFPTADDLEPNRTKIRYKAVEIGEVTAIHVAKDRKQVLVTAKIHRDASDYLVADTRFWVVRPRVNGGNVTGLGTLVSGAYIGVDVGQSGVKRRTFTGLEVPPIVTSGLPGRQFILHAEDIGSLTVGSTVFYRHIPAGEVVAYDLDPGGASVTIEVFVNSPYDAFVTAATRFWQASGVDMSISSDGVKLHTESLASILEGGVAFQQAAGSAATAPVAEDTSCRLFPDRDRAMQEPNASLQTFVMYFKGSLRGLSVGAPVDLRGITIGEVKKLSVEYERSAGVLRFPVEVDIFPQRILGEPQAHDHARNAEDASDAANRRLVDSLVAHGMRAEIKTGNLLTGQKYVALDIYSGLASEHVNWNEQPAVFPTTSGALDDIQDSVSSIAKKLDKIPFDQISARLMSTMASLDQTLKSSDRLLHHVNDSIAPQVDATLKEAQEAMQNAKNALAPDAPLQTDLSATLLQLSRAAKSVSALVDYLERHPEALIRGKPGDEP